MSGIPDQALAHLLARGVSIADTVDNDPRAAVDLVRRIDVCKDRLDIHLCLDPLLPPSLAIDRPILHQLSVPMPRLKRAKDVRLVIGGGIIAANAAADPALVRLIASARAAWTVMLDAGDVPLAEIAKAQGYSSEQFTRLLRLATLAPSIIQAIAEGHQPISLTRQRLAKITNIPLEWAAQRAALGFQ